MNRKTTLLYTYIVLLLISFKQAIGIIGYTLRPLDGYFCNTGLYTNVGQLTQPACTRSCIVSSNCMFLMYSPHTNTCLHLQGSHPCHLATPNPEIMIMRLRPSLQEQCLFPTQHSNNRLLVTSSGYPRVLSRKYNDDILCLGVSNNVMNSSFYVAGPEVTTVCPDVPKEIMAVHPSCTVAWVTYSAGEILPRGAIVMGYWNGKPCYSTRHLIVPQQTFGWYVEGHDVATYAFFGRKTSAVFDILISV